MICTPISVLLLGVSASPSSSGHPGHRDIKLYATEMSVQTEVEMTSVIGTPDGRIFMCGLQDGSLYELHYQEKEGWFGKRVQLINHSVGGMQSFLPRFSTPKTEGEKISPSMRDVSELFQIELFLLFRTTLGIVSTH